MYEAQHGASTALAGIAFACNGVLLGIILNLLEAASVRGHEDEIVARALASKDCKRPPYNWRTGLAVVAVWLAATLAHAHWGYAWDQILTAVFGGFWLGNLLEYPRWRRQWQRLRQAANDAKAAQP
jgi:hypothetical protein